MAKGINHVRRITATDVDAYIVYARKEIRDLHDVVGMVWCICRIDDVDERIRKVNQFIQEGFNELHIESFTAGSRVNILVWDIPRRSPRDSNVQIAFVPLLNVDGDFDGDLDQASSGELANMGGICINLDCNDPLQTDCPVGSYPEGCEDGKPDCEAR